MAIPLVLGFAGQFKQQPGWLVMTLSGTTVDKDPWVTLLEDGSGLVVPQYTTWLFNAWVVARGQVSTDDAGFQLSGLAARDAAGLDVLGTKEVTVARTSNKFKVRAVADGTNLAIQVKGLKDELVHWAARVEVTPVI